MTDSRLRFAVVACPKSGTTWTLHMLNGHPEAVCAETAPFGAFFRERPGTRPDFTVERVAFWTSERVCNATGRFTSQREHIEIGESLLRGYVETNARVILERSGKSVYGEKVTPYAGTAAHVFARLGWYDAGMPVVTIVRDPRDVAVSAAFHLARCRNEEHGGERARCIDDGRLFEPDFRAYVEHWAEVAGAISGHAPTDPRLAVRYEDLLEDPRPMLRGLFEGLSIASDDATVERCVEAGRFERLSGGRPRGQADASSFFRSGTAGGWREWLSPGQAAWVDER